MCAGDLIGWVAFRPEDVREPEGKKKQNRAENIKDEKEEKRVKHEKNPPFRFFFFSWP